MCELLANEAKKWEDWKRVTNKTSETSACKWQIKQIKRFVSDKWKKGEDYVSRLQMKEKGKVGVELKKLDGCL